MNDSHDNHPPSHPGPSPEEVTRRRFLERMSVALAGACAAMLAAPVVGFVIAPLFRRIQDTWISVGKTSHFEEGSTVRVPFPDPSPLPWAGVTANGAAWLRRDSAGQFTAFSVNCTHMGCPVRWLPGADLFMCPCHGGVYYQDGTVAAGPPPRRLVRFDVRVANDEVQIKAAAIPITTQL